MRMEIALDDAGDHIHGRTLCGQYHMYSRRTAFLGQSDDAARDAPARRLLLRRRPGNEGQIGVLVHHYDQIWHISVPFLRIKSAVLELVVI